MPTCSVSGCTKEKRDKFDPEHKFFTFPKTSPLVEKWMKFCRKDSLTKEQCLTKGPKVCSIHFKEEYIEIPLKYRLLPQFTPKNLRLLRKDAVPTIRNPKKNKENEQRQKKLEYSRIVAELLEQSEKDAAAEKERILDNHDTHSTEQLQIEKEAAEASERKKDTDGNIEAVIPTPVLEHAESSAARKQKTSTANKSSTSPSKEKLPKIMKTESSPDSKSDNPKTRKSSKKTCTQEKTPCTGKNPKSKSSSKKKKVSLADVEHSDNDFDVSVFEPGFQTEDVENTDNGNAVIVLDQHAEDAAAELLRLQRENKKLTDLTIKQSLQIADLIKQRNDLWREKGDLWFRKRMEQHQQQQQQQKQ